MRQPKWTIDETLLAVDTYFQIGDTSNIKADNPSIIELSEILRELPIHNNKDEIFRNIPGMKMTLYSIASLDKNARVHMQASKVQKAVFNYYIDKKHELRKIVNAIKNCLPLSFEYDSSIFAPFAMMGNILFQYHRYIEKKTQVAKQLSINAIERRKSVCNYCGIYLYEKYGEAGVTMLEFHYTEPVENYCFQMKPLQSKFIPLCPNCHKYAHSSPERFSILALN